jgi:hypothetical protein
MAFVGRWGSPENTVKKHELNRKLRKKNNADSLDLAKKEWENHKKNQDWEVPWAECNITESEIHGEKSKHCCVCNRFKRIIKQLEKEKLKK